MQLSSAHELRRAARRGVDIRCDLIAERWDRPLPSRCTEISPYGMWLETGMPLDIGQRVVVCFRPPRALEGEGELMLFAHVRRIERDERDMRDGTSGVALELSGVTDAERRLLTSHLRGLPPVMPGQKRRHR